MLYNNQLQNTLILFYLYLRKQTVAFNSVHIPGNLYVLRISISLKHFSLLKKILRAIKMWQTAALTFFKSTISHFGRGNQSGSKS